MNKFDKLAGKYFVFTLPLLVIFLIFSLIYGDEYLSQSEGIVRFLNDSFGWLLMLWILTSLYIFTKMIFSKSFRDDTLKKFVKVKDADERESLISGEAAKLSMISTFALITLLLFLSTITISIGKHQGQDLIKNDKKHFISIGFDPLLMNKKQKTVINDEKIELFTYSGLPIPSSIILLFVLGWQLISYQLIVRKNLKE